MTNENLTHSKEILHKEGCTLVLCNGNELIKSYDRGIKPLINLYESGKSFCDFCAADKVIGKAAAFMYVLLEIKEIYADVASELALDIFQKYGVSIDYRKCCPHIINRAGTGLCPMESAVAQISTPANAYTAICQKLDELSQASLSTP